MKRFTRVQPWALGATVLTLAVAQAAYGQTRTGTTGGSTTSTFGGSTGRTTTGSALGSSSTGSSFGGSNSFTGGTSFSGGSNSFTGGTSPSGSSNSFTGGASFSGGTAMTGGNTFGGGATGLQGGARSGSTSYGIISTGNPFASTYANPLAAGLPNGSRLLSFGTPLYGTVMNSFGATSAGRGGATTGLGGGFGGGSGFGNSGGFGGGSGFGNGGTSSTATRSSPRYSMGLGFESPARAVAAPTQPRPELQAALARSSSLPSGSSLQVLSQGDSIVLRGNVSNERQKRLAEMLLRLEPGVRDVRNELEVSGSPPPPSSP